MQAGMLLSPRDRNRPGSQSLKLDTKGTGRQARAGRDGVTRRSGRASDGEQASRRTKQASPPAHPPDSPEEEPFLHISSAAVLHASETVLLHTDLVRWRMLCCLSQPDSDETLTLSREPDCRTTAQRTRMAGPQPTSNQIYIPCSLSLSSLLHSGIGETPAHLHAVAKHVCTVPHLGGRFAEEEAADQPALSRCSKADPRVHSPSRHSHDVRLVCCCPPSVLVLLLLAHLTCSPLSLHTTPAVLPATSSDRLFSRLSAESSSHLTPTSVASASRLHSVRGINPPMANRKDMRRDDLSECETTPTPLALPCHCCTSGG